ncbi:hypothetical protein BT96DRAFT_991733 [Gymnopus androsaceus JB14]|uniref:Uncharacterized protein n=1 Tax=Gymnopus androsaceus JB14 TaxID=1447944 RepID=A0A6A4HXH6_9AGAR|nr:hypothetical protein BT96DRAFT_991733 [Gymnopus androsaceus JB14]
MAFYPIEEQDNPPGTEASVHAPQASKEPVIFQSWVTSGPYHIPTWLHYADSAITELKQVIETVEDFLSVHPELDLNVKDHIFKTAAWTHNLLISSSFYDPKINSHEHIQAIQVSVHKAVDNPLYIPKYTKIAQYLHALKPYHLQVRELESLRHFPNRKCAINCFLDKLHATKAERSVAVNRVPTRRAQSSTSVTTTGGTPHKVIIPGLPTLPGYQRTGPEAEVASASTATESMTIKANLLQGASGKMDIDDQGMPSQMGQSLSTMTKSQKRHLRRSKTECPLSFESDHEKAQLRDPMFNNFLQAIDIPSLANFEGQPPSAILATSNYHTIEYLDQLLKARLHNKATTESATGASSSAGPSGTSEAHATHPAPTPTEVPVQTSTVMVGTIPITVTAPSAVPEGPEEDMQSTFSA